MRNTFSRIRIRSSEKKEDLNFHTAEYMHMEAGRKPASVKETFSFYHSAESQNEVEAIDSLPCGYSYS